MVGDLGSSSVFGSSESDMVALIVEARDASALRNTLSLTEEREGFRSCCYANKLSDNRQTGELSLPRP